MDLLAPQSRTWKTDDFVPMPPRIKKLVVDGYRELLEVNRYLKKDAECTVILGRLADLGVTA